MDRRTFLKVLGGTAAGVAAAPLVTGTTGPLFIPAKNLEFGVPKPQLILPPTDAIWDEIHPKLAEAMGRSLNAALLSGKTVPMMLVHDNYIPEHGGRLKAGSIVWEDEATAARWGKHNVAVRCDGMQPEIIPGRNYGHGLKVTDTTSVPWIEQTTWEESVPEIPTRFPVHESFTEYESKWLMPEPEPEPEPKPGKLQVVKRLLSQGWTRP